jgi:hypothetical protein
MTLSPPEANSWEDFLREHDLERQPEAARSGRTGPSLTRVRREVARLSRGRPRKQPPVAMMADQKYCWGCASVLPLSSFATDRKTHDGKRAGCRTCDDAARVARDQARRARLKAQVAV